MSKNVFVLGPDPVNGEVVVLPLGTAERFLELQKVSASGDYATMGDFFDDAADLYDGLDEDYMIECYGDDWRDLPFTEDDLPEYGASDSPPTATFLMHCAAEDDDIYDEDGPLEGLLTWWDSMGSSLGGRVADGQEREVAARLRALGHEVVSWPGPGGARSE